MRIFVKPDGDDSNDGSSWGLAKRTLSSALSEAEFGDEVRVAAGTYYENIRLKDGVRLYGGFTGIRRCRRDPKTNITTIDGCGRGSVVTAYGVGSSTVIDGFTIRNGKAKFGGGIYCSDSSIVISNNTVHGNIAVYGGGICCGDGSPRILNTTVVGNAADFGGGVYLEYTRPTIEMYSNTISRNTARYGGGVCCFYTPPLKISNNNTITGNTGDDIYCYDGE